MTAKIKEWSKHPEIKMEIDLIGGLAASAYSIGPFKAEPLKVGSGNYLKGGKMVCPVTSKQDAAKTATLKLLFRDGATEVDLPFAVETVEVKN